MSANENGQRLDKLLEKTFPLLRGPLLYRHIRLKRIKLGGARTEGSERVKTGDVITLYVNDEFLQTDNDLLFMHASPNVKIVFEDENIIIADKPAGLLVHEDASERLDTLINRIKRYLYDKCEFDPARENCFAPALCNRIDRNTGGLVLAAKTGMALKILNEKLRLREIEKRYLCVIFGNMEKKEGTLRGFLTKNNEINQVTVSSSERCFSGEKSIVTAYRVLDEKKGLSLLEVKLITGRTHQIRAHFASIGHPLLGDAKYGVSRNSARFGFRFQALYSHSLKFQFQSDAGPLDYLNGLEFAAKDVPFVNSDKSGFKLNLNT